MATKINKTDKLLGFTNDTFQLVIKKVEKGSVWNEVELKVDENVQTFRWKNSETPEMIAARMKSTVAAFLKSSFDGFVIVGKVVKKNK